MMRYEEAEVLSKIVKSMAHPVRLMIIDALREEEMAFSKIFAMFVSDKSTISKHLQVLRDAGIVSSRKAGLDMIYRLEVPCVTDAFGCAVAVVENNVRRQQVCLCKR
jgi:ArsR family transcriptional regulator